MKKLVLSLILATLCGISAFAYDFSAVCESGQTLYYIITSSTEPYTVEVTNEETGWPYNNYTYVTGSLVIPQSVTFNGITYLVTSIGNYAFLDCHELTSVTIPNSVILIGERTFDYCRQLSSVNIGNQVETIKYRAFGDCVSITSIDIPNSVKTIETAAFEGCTGLTTITIPSSVEDMNYRPFEGCTSLTAINVDSGNTHYKSIDGVLFDYEVNVLIQYPGGKQGDYSIPNSVTRIRADAFSYCIGITSITIGSSLRTFEDYNSTTFYNCTSLTAINVAQGNMYYKSIDGVLFNHATDTIIEYPCGKSGSYSIPESVTRIGNCAFESCSGLTSITIPNSVTSIGSGAFLATGWYNNQPDGILYLDGWCLGYKGYEIPLVGDLIINEGTRGIVDFAFGRYTELTSVITPNSLMTIGNNAFFNCTGLATVTIGNSVTSIGYDAFYGCTGLSTVNFNAINCSIMSYYDYGDYYRFSVFTNCPNLTTLNIGDNVMTIPEYAFYDCTGLTSITIPNSVTSIGNRAFAGCSGLTGTLTIPNSVINIGECAFAGCSGLTGTLTIPSSVTSIANSTFAGCSGLTGTLIIPESVTNIGGDAFSGCSGLTGTLIIPSSITSIANGTFSNCTGLTSVVIPNSVTSIGGYAFRDCTGLTAITIPNSVTNIGERAFCGCSGVGTIIVESGNPIYDSRNNCNAIIETSSNNLLFGCKNTIIPDSVITIGESAFEGCRELIGELTIPNSVTSIGVDAFYYCSGLTSVFIGNSVRTIGPGAFWGCTNLTKIYLGNSVETIGGGAFWCVDAHFKSSTGTIYALGETPPTLSNGEDYEGIGVFPEEPYYENSFRRLIVCCGNRAAYEASDWAHYFSTIEEDCNRYNISSNSNTVQGGSFNISSSEARMGEEVFIYVNVDEGYEIDHVIAFNADNPNEIVPLSRAGSRYVITYSMIMPAFAVRIEVGFREGSGIENNESVELSLFPNPANDILNITSSETISEIEIVNVMGQVVRRIEVNSENAVCDVEELTSGVYMVRIRTASATLSQRKFVKE